MRQVDGAADGRWAGEHHERVNSGIGDSVVNDVEPKDRDIAMVFQSYALYPHMTVYENIAFPLQMAGLPKTEIASRVRSRPHPRTEPYLDRRPARFQAASVSVSPWDERSSANQRPS